MLTVTITRGISGSGKTTWAKEQVKQGQGNTVIVCKDDIRNMLWDGNYSKGREDIVKLTRNNLIRLALSEGKNVISADTNFDNHEEHIREVVRNWCLDFNKQVDIKVQSFEDVPLQVCIDRDANRPNPLGEKIIRDQYKRWMKKEIKPLEQDEKLPKSVVVDADGTMCINCSGRSPFDWNRVGEDEPDEVVCEMVRNYYYLGYQIVVVSGRDGCCYDLTKKWLDENNIPFQALLMREAGDNRKDTIVKEEIFWRDIFGKYNVKFVLDDRDSVVRDTWRKIGLKCLQVAEGDF